MIQIWVEEKYPVNERTGQAILIAIRKEADSRAFYREVATRVRNPLVRRRLQGLADDETQHQETLSRLYWSQTGREPGEITPESRPGALAGMVEGPDPASLDLHALLKTAMDEEKRAAGEYDRMARGEEDGRVRSFIEYLADWERGHAETISRELERIEAEPGWPGTIEEG